MRSLLFVPGHSARMMAKAATSGADVLVLDLEDAVHPDSKPAARQVVVEALDNRSGEFSGDICPCQSRWIPSGAPKMSKP